MFTEWLSRVRFAVFGKRRSEVDEELQFHIERQIEANLAAGMPADEARRQAIITFGGRERAREQCREARPGWSLELVLRDLRLGIRGLLRNPGLSSVAVLTLALAIGANSTIFSLLSQALLRALPVRDPQQLVVLNFGGATDGHTHSEGGDRPGHHYEFSYPMYRDLRDQNHALSGLIASAVYTTGATWENHSEAVDTELVSGNYFQVLGVRPALGRVFGAADETAPGANPVAVLNFDYWRTHLAEAPVAGRPLSINGVQFTILGVAAPGFRSAVWGRTPEIYVPLTMQKVIEPDWDYLADHHSYWITVAGRLQPGVTSEQASASMNPLFHALRRQEFATAKDQSAGNRGKFVDASRLNLESGAQGFSPLRDDLRTPLMVIMGMVMLVIAMAVVNVASLLLVRAANRVREFSIRYAMGATAGQIVRQLLCEGMLLGLFGSALGIALTPEALRLLLRWMQGRTGDVSSFMPTLDWRVFAFTAGAMFAGSVIFSLAPAVQFWNPRLADALKQQASNVPGGSLRFRRTCVALQIGFSLLLVVGAGMFVRTIQNLRNTNPGFATDHLLAFQLAPELAGYPGPAVAPVEQRVLDAISGLPGIRAVGATNDADLIGEGRGGDVSVSGYTPKPDENFDAELPWVSSGYLQTMGVPLVAGRLFNDSDTATSLHVAVVNESFARHFFANPRDILGHHFARPDRPRTDAIIVGIVRDVKHSGLRDPVLPTCYTLFQQGERPGGLMIYIRTWQAPDVTANSIRAAVANIDSKLIVDSLSTMKDQIDQSILAERTMALLSTIFGLVAALLAGIGLYGILAYSTAQRTREIGIRMALGAQRGNVVGLILQETLVLAGIAVGVTIPIALLATWAVRSQLYGVSIADPMTYAAGILAIALVAGFAGFIPARRAAGVDPSRALRTE
ncbi:MAG TPA: ABC transporter permease [Terracidiphilus sp.]|jgi:predicted permease